MAIDDCFAMQSSDSKGEADETFYFTSWIYVLSL